MAPTVSKLLTYPIKSCRHIELTEARIDSFGFQFDRNWAIIDPETGKLITCREVPKMVLLQPEMKMAEKGSSNQTALEIGGTMTLHAPGMDDIDVPFPAKESAKSVVVDVWGDRSDALDEGDEVAAWLEKYMGRKARLVVKDLRQGGFSRSWANKWCSSDVSQSRPPRETHSPDALGQLRRRKPTGLQRDNLPFGPHRRCRLFRRLPVLARDGCGGSRGRSKGQGKGPCSEGNQGREL